MRAKAKTAILATSAALAALLVPACGGGGNNNSTRTPCLQFTADAAPVAGIVAAQDDASSTCDLAVVDFFVTDQADVYGANIQLTYDSSEVSFAGASVSDTFLDDDGEPVQLVTGGPIGQVTVGVSRLQTNTGIGAVGTRRLVRVTFARISADNGTSDLDVTIGELLDPGPPPAPIAGLTFTGGTLRIDRI